MAEEFKRAAKYFVQQTMEYPAGELTYPGAVRDLADLSDVAVQKLLAANVIVAESETREARQAVAATPPAAPKHK